MIQSNTSHFLLLALLFISFLSANGQCEWSAAYLQTGVNYNFLMMKESDYSSGGLGSNQIYEIENLRPLPGFTIGFVPELKMTDRISLRTGLLFSYHVNSATLNFESNIWGYSKTTSTNIRTRFRNLYAQVPIEIAFSFGSKKKFSVYGGLKAEVIVGNEGVWENTTIHKEYIPLVKSDTSDQKEKPALYPLDVALELGFQQMLSGYLVLEERVYNGLFNVSFADETSLKQLTIEIILGWKACDFTPASGFIRKKKSWVMKLR